MVNLKKFVFNADIAAAGVLLCSTNLIAQVQSTLPAETPTEIFGKTYYDTVAFFILAVVVLIIAGFLYFGQGAAKDLPEKASAEVWSKIKYLLNHSIPLEKENEILLDHDYDGIKELDNRVPPWFSYLFYASIIFGIYYILNFHVLKSGALQTEEYTQEMQFAAMQKAELERSGALVNEQTVTLLSGAEALNEGKTIFTENCIACHGSQGGGLIGPNLTDDYWIHGGGIKNIFKIIKYGVPAKGMISWETQLDAKQIQAVSSYIISLHGTNPANAKQPEGLLYEPADSVTTSKL